VSTDQEPDPQEIYQVDVPIPLGNFVTHSVTTISMMNDKGEVELVVATRGSGTMTTYLGLLSWASHDILSWT
jgi:hypothetical protein